MPESIITQVGQCGNQIGFRVWESTMKEYSELQNSLTENEMCYFLKPKKDTPRRSFNECYSARAVLIDMEESVINEVCRGPHRSLFDKRQILTDVSGSGNNWARGNIYYGTQYHSKIEEIFRKEAEECNKLESFLFMFSMGGGTGSGLGTAVLECVHSMFPKIPRIVFTVFPSDVDDVITSPYNAVLANNKLAEHANLIVPFDNQALSTICNNIEKVKNRFQPRGKYSLLGKTKGSKMSDVHQRASKPFDDMNDLIASVICDFTSCSRLPGTLNIDINELVLNMTPYPNLKFVIPSSSPFILVPEDLKMERVFQDVFLPSHVFVKCHALNKSVLSSAILARGKVSVEDLQNNLARFSSSVQFVEFMNTNIKTGFCNFAPPGRHVSLLKLANTCGIVENLASLNNTFCKMYQKRAHLHHYISEKCEADEFNHARNILQSIIDEYSELERAKEHSELSRLKVV